MNSEYDIIIIGAGIIGTAAAREFSRYSSSILLLEKGRDAALGATRANSGIVHGGYTAKAGTRKGEFSIRGNRMYRQLSEELGFAYRRTGSLVLAFDEEQRLQLQGLLDDLVVIPLAVMMIVRLIPEPLKEELQATAEARMAMKRPHSHVAEGIIIVCLLGIVGIVSWLIWFR